MEVTHITPEDMAVLTNIATNNNIDVHEILGLLMDGYLNNLVKTNNWQCDYQLEHGSPWVKKPDIAI